MIPTFPLTIYEWATIGLTIGSILLFIAYLLTIPRDSNLEDEQDDIGPKLYDL